MINRISYKHSKPVPQYKEKPKNWLSNSIIYYSEYWHVMRFGKTALWFPEKHPAVDDVQEYGLIQSGTTTKHGTVLTLTQE